MRIKSVFLPYATTQNGTADIYNIVIQNMGYKTKFSTKNYVNVLSPWKGNSYIIPPSFVKKQTFLKRVNEELPNINKNNFKNALKIASFVHKEEKRINGSNYLTNHIYPVALYYLITQKKLVGKVSNNAFLACILHDAVENSQGKVNCFTKNKTKRSVFVIEEQINKRVAKLVYLVSKVHKGKKINNNKYLKQVLSSKVATTIKCVDRLLNLSCDVELHSKRKIAKINDYYKESLNEYPPLFKKANPYYNTIFKITLKAIKEANKRQKQQLMVTT